VTEDRRLVKEPMLAEIIALDPDPEPDSDRARDDLEGMGEFFAFRQDQVRQARAAGDPAEDPDTGW